MIVMFRRYFTAVLAMILTSASIFLLWKFVGPPSISSLKAAEALYSRPLDSLVQNIEEEPAEPEQKKAELPASVTVVTDGANVRTSPGVEEDNITQTLTKGDWAEVTDDYMVDGTVWYEIISPIDNQKLWISSKAVKAD